MTSSIIVVPKLVVTYGMFIVSGKFMLMQVYSGLTHIKSKRLLGGLVSNA